MSISTGDTLFPLDHYSHHRFRIHLIDKEVEEAGIIQHHQAQPGTQLSKASPRELLNVGMYVVMDAMVSPF